MNRINADHAQAILQAIAEFFDNNAPVHPGALLFDDDKTLQEHVTAALGGVSLEVMGKRK